MDPNHDPQPFDRVATGLLAQAAADVLRLCPEVRGVAVAIDYHGSLNDAAVAHQLWLERGGDGAAPVQSLPAVFGGLAVTARLLRAQADQASTLLAALRGLAEEAGRKVVQYHEQIAALQAQLQDQDGDQQRPQA